jgi:FlaA1/EpsC-like NDP-sugar epimerase
VINEFPAILQRSGAHSWAQILGRPAETPDPFLMPCVAGRRILVTGAGGFIGSEMARSFAASEAERIILLDISEQALFDLDREMTAADFGDRCVPVLGSVCDLRLLASLFAEHRPEIVLHAAALKHVPLMERNPLAAVETNALGTWRLAHTAAEHGVRKTVLVSTDKAVAPHSIMGASKRIAEMAMLDTGFTAVRLANVIGSPGSVAPLFAKQIERGEPLIVTHHNARRYFFTLNEVTALLSQALSLEGAQGVLVPDAGVALLISELAQRMIEASGKHVPIVFDELRPGDKLAESLVGSNEQSAGFATAALRRVTGVPVSGLETRIIRLEGAVAARDLPQAVRLVEDMVPDYQISAVLRETACATR